MFFPKARLIIERQYDKMIKAENLVKRYGSNYALNDVSFEIGEGEIVGLLGPNGAGKSTAMNILTGYLSATSGSAYVNGINILDNPIEAKKYIGFLPEQPPLYPEMTVKEYLGFVYELKSCTLDREAHIAEILSVVRLTDVKDRLIANLSKGYKQRVGIAQALIGDPKVIIFDEPTVGLDPKQILEVRNLIRTLGKRHTVILSTHILAEVQAVCERVIIINKGNIIANERTEDLTKKIEDGYHYEARIIGSERDVIASLKRISGVKEVTNTGITDGTAIVYDIETVNGRDVRSDIYRVSVSGGYTLIGLAAVGTDLESVFIRLVDRSDKKAEGSARKTR